MEEYIVNFNRKEIEEYWEHGYPLNLKAIVRDERRITRCKDCKYYERITGRKLHWCDYFSSYRAPEDYCSCGKRKENEEE